MAGFRDSLESAVRGFYCTVSGPAATGLQVLGGVYNGLGAEDQGDDLLETAGLLRAAQNAICDRPPDAGDVEGLLPFAGGQCDCVEYVYERRFVSEFGETPWTPTSSRGPISYRRERDGIFTKIILTSKNSQCVLVDNLIRTTNDPNDTLQVEIRNMERADALPDDCGNPPSTLPPYDPDLWTSPVPVVYDPVGGGPSVEIEPTVRIDPHLNVGGNIIAPISITFQDGSSLFGDFNLNTGDLNFGPGNSGGGGTGTGPSEGDPEVPPEEQPGVLVGLRVVSSELGGGSSTIIYQEDAPNFVIPRTGMVNFAYKVGGSISWGVPVDVRNFDQVIWAGKNAVDWAVTPSPGWELDVTPLFGPDCPPC